MPRPEIVTSVAKRETDLAALKSDRLLEPRRSLQWILRSSRRRWHRGLGREPRSVDSLAGLGSTSLALEALL